MTSNNYPMQEAFRRFYPAFYEDNPSLSSEKEKAAFSIMNCKTGTLGYNASICEECGTPVIHSVSCNNRNCPCCGTPQTEKWELERNTELVKGLAYYHVVFTVPHDLNQLIQENFVLLINLFFRCVHETLLTLCADKRYMGATPGILSVLHTWGQKLTFHPHIHVCISGGGITPSNQFVETRHDHFFLPEPVLAKMFRGKYLCHLKKLYVSGKLSLSGMKSLREPSQWQAFINRLFDARWLPFVKETFNGKGNAIRYLARYSNRTAISNSRISSVGAENVSFRYKDYADQSRTKIKTVKGSEFIALYLQHVLPPGFHRIRFAGYLTNRKKTACLKLIHRLRNTIYSGNPYRNMPMAELMLTLYDKDICTCPECNGRLIRYPRGKPIPMRLLHSIASCSAAD